MFRPRSLESEIRVIKISATALTQETECKIQLRLGNFMLTWGSLCIFLDDTDRGRESEGSF